jgi:hypothetical protein
VCPAQQALSSTIGSVLLVVVIDEHALFRKLHRSHELDRADGPALLVAVRRVNQDRQVVGASQLDLLREAHFFAVGLIVEADLADGDDSVLVEITGQQGEHFVGQLRVVRFLRVQADRAEMPDAELRRAKALPPSRLLK